MKGQLRLLSGRIEESGIIFFVVILEVVNRIDIIIL